MAYFAQRGKTVCVYGAVDKIRKTDLQGKFGEYGHIIRMDILVSKQVAFVEFEDARDAYEAVEYTNGTKLHGVPVRVQIADDRPAFREQQHQQDDPGVHGREGNRTRSDRRSGDVGGEGRRNRNGRDPRRSHSAEDGHRSIGPGSGGRGRSRSRSRSQSRKRSRSRGRSRSRKRSRSRSCSRSQSRTCSRSRAHRRS
uniref:RRM domain-containing protein n=1 Tax=Alexandrium catenella TaxID=2925 RepID=A0A7S1Q1I6_ALECA|mmetsp:Transcript_13535/g.37216  ORF Transcript_13535/g.37216 Transcript_13535/m.37216 type:complete len:197 (+) Transcript_13535:56-646(+)